VRVKRTTLDRVRNMRYRGSALPSNERRGRGLVARVRDSSRGIVIAGLIVLANFVVVLQITGISYGRFQWTQFASAYDTPTATPTVTATPTRTATATATRTRLPDGDSCRVGTDCTSNFCVTGVCCNRACNRPGAVCNLPDRPGVCVDPAAAPAMSSGGLVGAVALLIGVGALTLLAVRRRDRTAR
jgi:hypothetical protein